MSPKIFLRTRYLAVMAFYEFFVTGKVLKGLGKEIFGLFLPVWMNILVGPNVNHFWF
jgi:hypothetical protein